MQSVLPLLGIFAVFSPALMLPGPDFVAVVRNTMTSGKAAGVLTALGVSLGITTYAGLSAAGLATLLNQIDWFGWFVRAAGASFLSYLGVRLLFTRHPAEPFEPKPKNPTASQRNPMVMGLLVNLTNPKAIVFFASIFGTAIRPDTPPWVLTAVVAVIGLCGFVWFSTVSFFTASTGLLVRLEDYQHWIERLAGLAFLGFAGKLVFDLATR
ncbi:MAG: LysE family transporter [Spiribacter sp.]|jgi:threonine/homoserine/homoserine lactone efflux protein|nr:LysE family transporter [Spiribacter sp.]MDR9490005.1 LysE family transporter [Spiribacter sp.]